MTANYHHKKITTDFNSCVAQTKRRPRHNLNN